MAAHKTKLVHKPDPNERLKINGSFEDAVKAIFKQKETEKPLKK